MTGHRKWSELRKNAVLVRADSYPVGAYRAQQAACDWIVLADVVRLLHEVGWEPGVGMYYSLGEARERFERARV